MKTPNFIVRIPEPCHEDWNKMEPDLKGKFCNSCNKSVFDFSTKTDAEIKNILLEYKDQKVCGHFKKSQVNRPLNISINLKDLPKNINITKAFAIALFLVFGTFLFSCTDKHGQKVSEIEVVETEPQPQDDFIGIMGFAIPSWQVDSGEASCSTFTGDLVFMESEGAVSGVTSIEEVVPEEIVVLDSVVKSEPIPENFIVGLMEVRDPEIDSTSVLANDSSGLYNSRKIETDESIINSNELVIYPNPSNGEFTIKYELKKRTNVRIDIFDTKGVLIKTIVDIPNQYDGKYKIPVNLNELPNGIYLVNYNKGNKMYSERLVIVK